MSKKSSILNKKEIIAIILATLILGFIISLIQSLQIFLYTSLAILLIILINTFAKKIISHYFDSEIEVKLWEINRYGFRAHHEFKRPFQAGAFLPIISKIFLFPITSFVWMASLVFDVKAKVHRAVKRHGFYSFSEMTEFHIGLIATTGIVANLIFAAIGYFTGYTEFAKLSIYYIFFNMLPVSDLDGNKIFFGSLSLWTFLEAIILIILAGIVIIV